MKNFSKIVFASMLFLLIAFFGCKKEQEEVIAPDPKEVMQKEFLNTIAGYPMSPLETFKQGLGEGTYTIVMIPKGKSMTYVLGNKTYTGVLQATLYLLKKGDEKPVMKNGAIVQNTSFMEHVQFQIMAFPTEKVWSFDELNTYLKPYPLTVVQLEDFWQHLVADYEEFVDLNTKNSTFKVLQGPTYILQSPEGTFLFGNDKRPWHRRK